MKKILSLFSVVIISSLAAVGVVSASTTISTDISTGGQLTVTGTSTLMGNVGIGTTASGDYNLNVQSNNDTNFFLGSSTGQAVRFEVRNDGVGGYTNDSFAIWNGIDTPGNITGNGLILQYGNNYGLVFNRDVAGAFTTIQGNSATTSNAVLTLLNHGSANYLYAGPLIVTTRNVGIIRSTKFAVA